MKYSASKCRNTQDKKKGGRTLKKNKKGRKTFLKVTGVCVISILSFQFFSSTHLKAQEESNTVDSSVSQSETSAGKELTSNTSETKESSTSSESVQQLDPSTAEVFNSNLERKLPDQTNRKEISLKSNATGIVAKNIAKNVIDIKSVGSDVEKLKQTIIKDSGAIAYGLSGGAISDVTDQIQIDNLEGLESLSSNALKEFRVTLKVPAALAGTEEDLSTEVIVYVGKVAKPKTWAELDAALKNSSITIIDVQNSMTNTRGSRNDINIGNTRSNYVLLGNGHSLDFIGDSYRWPTSTTAVHKAVVDNVNLYGGHYFGPITMWEENGPGSGITYRNVHYTGSQLTASFQAILRFEEKNVIRSVATSYVSYNGTRRSIANTNQSGLESHTLVFGKDTDTTIEVENGDGIILGSWYSNTNWAQSVQPSAVLEENAIATIRTLGNGGESNSWQTSGGTIQSAISIQRNGKIVVGKNAALNVETANGTTRVPVRLGYQANTSQWVTSISVGEGGKFNVNANGPISTTAARAAIMLQQNSVINIANGAVMTVNAQNMTTGAPVIDMGANSKLNVGSKGQLVLNKIKGTGRSLQLSSGAQFEVKDEGTAHFASIDERNSTDSQIYAGNSSSFFVGNKAVFESVITNGSGKRSMLDFGSNTIFRFANAKRIDLDSRGNTNVDIVKMTNPGIFLADIQEVSAWTKRDAYLQDPTYNWTPMYGVKVGYNGTRTSSVVANSVINDTQKNFLNEYRTENFSRVLYQFIPDVVVGLDIPCDNKKLIDGEQLTGAVNNFAAIQFYIVSDENDPSKDVLLTPPTVDSPIDGDTRKFHTIADGNGRFTYKLPDNVELKAGQKIKAYAWLDGKDAFAIEKVLDATAPTGESVDYHIAMGEKTADASKFVGNPSDTNPEPQKFKYVFNEETPQAQVEEWMQTPGEYTVRVDLFDAAGNKATIVSKLIVHGKLANIEAKDIQVSAAIINGMKLDQLKKYIIQESEANAYQIMDGTIASLKDKIEISDLGGMTPSTTGGAYNVTLKVSSAVSGLGKDLIKVLTVTLTDDTPPSGTGKLTIVPMGDAAFIREEANLSKFLETWQDDVTAQDKLAIRFAENTDFDALVAKEGDNEFYLILTDEAGNDSEPVKVPIFVFDGPGGANSIKGKDFRVDHSDWQTNSTTVERLREFVITQGKIKAIEVNKQTIADITKDTSKFTVNTKDVGNKEETPYPLVLTVNSNGEKKSVTIYVTFNDKTKPKGTGKFTLIDKEDTAAILNAADYMKFLTDWSDNVTAKEEIDITLKENQDIAKIVSSVGPNSFYVTLTDEAGNMTDVKVPIYVKDKQSIIGEKYIIERKNFSIAAIDYPKTPKGILAMIRDKGQLQLFEISDTTVTELNGEEIVLATGSLPEPSPSGQVPVNGDYEVTLTYGNGKSKVQGTLTVTISKSLDTVKVEFIDEKGLPIADIDSVVITGNIGDSVDLTSDKNVKDTLAAIAAKKYVLDKEPANVTEVIIQDGGNVVQYKFKGTLSIDSGPKVINFGTQNISWRKTVEENPEYDEPLVIWDNRATLTNWKLTVKLSQELEIVETHHVLAEALKYKTATDEKTLTTDAQEILTHKHSSSGKYNVSSETWGPAKQGLRLEVLPGMVKQIGDYQANLTWRVEETY